jgi:tetratricopeptide (TPR) repeat protein
VTLYVVLAGKPPFQEPDLEKLLPQVQRGEFPPPRQWKPAIPRALEAICLRAMALQPEKRYATALDLAADVEHWLADEPVTAYRDPLPARLGRWGRRHKPLLTGSAALLLTAVVALAIGMALIRQQQVHTQQAKEAAEQQRDRAERNFGLARRAVEDTITKVAENPLLKRADFHDLRKQLLASAVPYYQEFVQQQSDDPELQAEHGRAYYRLAYVRAEMGEKEGAVADYREAEAILARLEAAFPDQPAYPQGLARSYHNLGMLLSELGRLSEAEKEYREALALREKLVEKFPVPPDYRSDLARSHSIMGNLLADLGRRDEAEKAFRAALALQEKLVEQFPALPAYRQELAGSHNNLGILLAKVGRRDEAEKEFRAGLHLQEKLVEQFPAQPDYRSDLAASHNNLGALLGLLGRRDEAEKACRSALVLQDKLAEQFPALPAYRQDLARSHNNLGILLAALGRRDAAEKEYRAALALQEKLAEQFPAVPDYAVGLGGGYVNFGHLVHKQGQPQAALPWLDKAIDRLQAVFAKDRRLATARKFLRNAHEGRAEALTQLKRHVEAIRDWDRAIELDDGSLRNGLRLQRAGCLAQTGEHARAVAEANALTERKDVQGPTLYDAARVCALAAASVKDDAKLSEQYAGRAVAVLRQAQKAGHFKQPATIAHMKKDDDLRALRVRPDYRDLLKELETPAKP